MRSAGRCWDRSAELAPLLGDRTSAYMTHQQVRHVAWLLGTCVVRGP